MPVHSVLEPPGQHGMAQLDIQVPRVVHEESSSRTASKRSSSSSNDLLHERDRFRARLHTLNGRPTGDLEPTGVAETSLASGSAAGSDSAASCDVCDIIQLKTARLQVQPAPPALAADSPSPLSNGLSFFQSLPELPGQYGGAMALRLLTYTQLVAVFHHYFNQRLPKTSRMFPWLHGLHPDNYAQRRFFCGDESEVAVEGPGTEKANGLDEQARDDNHTNDLDSPRSHGHTTASSLNSDSSQIAAESSSETTQTPTPTAPNPPRFLMCVSASEGPPVLRNTVHPLEILHPIDVSRAEIVRFLTHVVTTVFPASNHDTVLDTLLADCYSTRHLPVFLNLDPSLGVSLRNFHIQVAKLAACSDMVVYCFRSDHLHSCECQSLARVLWVAQRYDATRTESQAMHYNTLVMDDRRFLGKVLTGQLSPHHPTLFTALPDLRGSTRKTLLELRLLLFDPQALAVWDLDFAMKEKVETTRMSAALGIGAHVWAGNVWDFQALMMQLNGSGQGQSQSREGEDSRSNAHNSSKSQGEGSTPKNTSSPIQPCENPTNNASLNSFPSETPTRSPPYPQKLRHAPRFGAYCDPASSIVNKDDIGRQSIVSILPPPAANWRLLVHCCSDAQFPDLAELRQLMFKFSIASHRAGCEYHMLEFPPAGSVGIGDCKKENLLAVVNTCKLLHLYALSTSSDPDVAAALIYCLDGYTELSLLVLSYVMYARNASLDEAILVLHCEFQRPFYIFASDVHILRKLEPLLRQLLPLVKKVDWSALEVFLDEEITRVLLAPGSRPRHAVGGSVGNTVGSSGGFAQGYSVGNSVGSSVGNSFGNAHASSFRSNSSPEVRHNVTFAMSAARDACLEQPLLLDTDWVADVDGSLPSRILPYLYLGSLKHANSLALLSKLGISKIISVGERLDWLSVKSFQDNNAISVREIDGGNIESISISGSSPVDAVLKVNNLQDDGIDDLAWSLPEMLAFIASHRGTDPSGRGGSKILVHCRVGVSRSATVVMAEVMHRLGILVAKAYLYVRVRRLNIIIQPNLRFMYELFKWEEAAREKMGGNLREVDWFVFCREVMSLNLPYLRK